MASQSISFRPTAVIRQIPWSLDQRAALGLLLILITFSLVGWLYLGQASVITSSTLQIERLQQEIALLDQSNAELALDVAEGESLDQIKARARSLGFEPVEPSAIRYLPIQDYPTTVTHDSPNLVQTVETDQTLWQFWLDSITAWIVGAST
ncbi:MAG: hypothetical protein AAF629_16005 [Chloroflexota bacterium]